MELDWSFLGPDNWQAIRHFILPGLLFSIELTIVSTIGGIFIGTILALMRRSNHLVVRWIASLYVDFIRSIPLMMVLLFFFISASALGVYSAFITFTLFEAAYFSEIVRAGIKSVAPTQLSASIALGMNYRQSMALIVLPQAFRNMIPVFLTQVLVLFQDTSLVYVMGAIDLLKGFTLLGTNQGRIIEAYTAAAVTYWVICFTLSRLVMAYQKRVAILR